MGLDSYVYCDCYEKGRIKTPPPLPDEIIVDGSGCPYLASEKEIEKVWKVIAWIDSSPCDHYRFELARHHLGNVGGIAVVRAIVAKMSEAPDREFPMLWSKVIYSGIHGGDYLLPTEVKSLASELDVLMKRDLTGFKQNDTDFFWDFIKKLRELISASLSVNKPLAF